MLAGKRDEQQSLGQSGDRLLVQGAFGNRNMRSDRITIDRDEGCRELRSPTDLARGYLHRPRRMGKPSTPRSTCS